MVLSQILFLRLFEITFSFFDDTAIFVADKTVVTRHACYVRRVFHSLSYVNAAY